MANKSNPDIYRPIDVPDILKPYVRRALVADASEPIDMLANVHPTGYHYFGWIWRGRWQGIVNGETRFDSDIDGAIHLSGQIRKSEVVASMERDFGHIVMELSALGHFQMLGITGAKIVEDAQAPQILNPALKPLLEKKFRAENMSINARMELMVDVLSQLPKHTVPDGMIAAIERMEAVDGDIRIFDLVAELGLAERKFRTDFKTLVGLSPKAFCKALQINRALNHLLVTNGGDLAGVATQAGFSDQAHFTRAFGNFLGKAPARYPRDIETTLARFMGQSRQ